MFVCWQEKKKKKRKGRKGDGHRVDILMNGMEFIV